MMIWTLKKRLPKKKLREKCRIWDVSKFFNLSDILRIHSLTVVEDYDVEETSIIHENDKFKYVISQKQIYQNIKRRHIE